MIKWTPKVGQKILCTGGRYPRVYIAGKRYEVTDKGYDGRLGLWVVDEFNSPQRFSVCDWHQGLCEVFQDPQDIEDSKEKTMKTGDRVVHERYGAGRVIGVPVGTDQIGVEFDQRGALFHDGNGVVDKTTHKVIEGKLGHCWYVPESELKQENKAMFTKGQWVICNEGNETFGLLKGSVHKVGDVYTNGNMEVFQYGNSECKCWEQRRFSLLVSTLPVIHALTNERFLAIGPKGAVEFVRRPHESVWDSGMAALKAFGAPAMPEVKGNELTLAIEVAKSIGQERRARYSKKDGTERDCKIKVTSIDGTKVYFVHVERDGIRQVDVSQIEAFETKDGKLMVR